MRCINHRAPLAVLLFSLLPAWGAQAQIVPDAGRSIRELESRPLQLPPPVRLELNVPAAETAAMPGDGPTLRVEEFRITGNRTLGDTELLPLLADLAGRELTLAELRGAAQRLSDHYRARGFVLARAYLPAQSIERGVVTIDVLEGRYGDIVVDNPSRLREAAAAAPLRPLRPGDPVRAAALERSLLLLADTPGVAVQATLRPGAAVGTSDLAIALQPGPALGGALELDNHGSRHTGEYRLGGTLNLNNPLGLGDVLTLRALATDERQRYYRAAYQLPVGPFATRLGVAYSDMDYELAREFEDLDAHGNARIASAYAIQPLLRSRGANLYAQLQFDDKRLRDEIELFVRDSAKSSRVWTASLNGDLRDDLGGGAVSSFALGYSRGDLNLDDPIDRLVDAVTARTRGGFDKFDLALVRLQQLAGRFSLYARAQGQWAGDNLDSSEKFSLGGAYGVRAYPQGEAAADQGWLVNVELRYALTHAWQLGAFVDHGEARLDKSPWVDGDNHHSLSAAGVTASWNAHGWRVSATAAWKLGAEQARSDSDRSPRIWGQIVRRF